MGDVLVMPGGGGGVDCDNATAKAGDILAGKTAGIAGADEPVPGTMPNRGAWTGSVGMNGRVAVPGGHHNGAGYVDGPVVTQRGAPTYNLPINGTQNLPEGYYTGGKVAQSIPTMGAQTITPSASQQTVSCNGKYMTGNVVVKGVSAYKKYSYRNNTSYDWIVPNDLTTTERLIHSIELGFGIDASKIAQFSGSFSLDMTICNFAVFDSSKTAYFRFNSRWTPTTITNAITFSFKLNGTKLEMYARLSNSSSSNVSGLEYDISAVDAYVLI